MIAMDYASTINGSDYLGHGVNLGHEVNMDHGVVNDTMSNSEVKIEGRQVDIDDGDVLGGECGEVVYISYEGGGDIDEETLSNLISQYPGGYMLLNGTQ